jgi:hypothetical protein
MEQQARMMTPVPAFAEWLAEWNRELLERLDLRQQDAFRDPRVTAERVRDGWLGSPGASVEELARTETRLGTSLPPSYRAFLQASNGFLLPGLIVPRLRAAEEIGWLREEDPDAVDSWSEFAEPGSVEADLGHCLLVSDRELIGTAVYLLNPSRRHGDEWEAVHLAHWAPGAESFASFWDLLVEERRRFNEAPDSATTTQARGGRRRFLGLFSRRR